MPHSNEVDPARSLLLGRIRGLYRTARQGPKRYPGGSDAWVHDVRVASRRLETALAMMAPRLPAKRRGRVELRAKRLRRRLGRCRERDVIWAELEALATPEERKKLAPTHRSIDKAQRRQLRACLSHYDDPRLRQHQRWARKLEPNRDIPFADLAGTYLVFRSEQAESLLPSLSHFDEAERHHKLRIRIKQLRYGVEGAEANLQGQMDVPSTLKQLKKLQDALGSLNDAVDLETFVDESLSDHDFGPRVRQLRGERYRFASGLVQANLPELLAQIRRAAGKTGHIALR